MRCQYVNTQPRAFSAGFGCVRTLQTSAGEATRTQMKALFAIVLFLPLSFGSLASAESSPA